MFELISLTLIDSCLLPIVWGLPPKVMHHCSLISLFFVNEYLWATYLTFFTSFFATPSTVPFLSSFAKEEAQYSKYNFYRTLKEEIMSHYHDMMLSYGFYIVISHCKITSSFFKKYSSRFPKCPLKFSCNFPICTFLNHVPFCYTLSTFPFSFPFCFLDFNALSNLILPANMRIISVRTSSVSLVKIMLTLIPAYFLLWRESLCYIWILRMAFLHTAMGEPEPITI